MSNGFPFKMPAMSCHPVAFLTRTELTDLRIGSIVYPLRSELTGSFVRALEELFVDGVSPSFVGKGHSAQEATEAMVRTRGQFQNIHAKKLSRSLSPTVPQCYALR